MKNDWSVITGGPDKFPDQVTVTWQCLAVANAAHFPTDFNDVREHLYGNPGGILCMVYDQYGKIVGFAVFAKLDKIDTLHLHGIVIHPDAQGAGLASKMISDVIEMTSPKYLTAKTHNPRMFETISHFACSEYEYYPNGNTNVIPAHIYELVKNNEFVSTADEFLIVRNAYPDEKISQPFKEQKIGRIFMRLNANDAQVAIAAIK